MPGPSYHARTHLPDGTDPLPGFGPVAPSLATTIIALTGLDAFWKLNESSGNVAADSSGNGYDLGLWPTSPATSPPVWGQSALPPGETSAKFASTRGLHRIHHTAYSTNFSAFGWIRRDPGGHFDAIIGQGDCAQVNSWSIAIESSAAGGGLANKLSIYAGATPVVSSDAALADSTDYMVALTRGASTWKLYLNGVQQVATSTGSPGTVPAEVWLGNDDFSAFGNKYFDDGLESYMALVAREMTAQEIADLYEIAGFGGAYPAGYVWTSNGDGTAYWAPSTIEVTY